MDAAQPEGDNQVSIGPNVWLPTSALRFTFSRSGGPGGQNVNKLNTRATLSVPLAALGEALPPWAMARLVRAAGQRLTAEAIQISAADSRSQLANRQACLERLREMVVAALNRPRPRRATRPTKGSVQRRLTAKKQHSQRKAARREDRGMG